MSAIIADEAPPLGKSAPQSPEALALIVERCLAKEPRERFDSTGDLARAVQNIVDHLRSGRTMAPVPAVRKQAPRGWAWTAVISIVFTLGIIGAWQVLAPPPPDLPNARQVALLPFANVAGVPANQALADGLAEVLTTRLTQLEPFARGLQVGAGRRGARAADPVRHRRAPRVRRQPRDQRQPATNGRSAAPDDQPHRRRNAAPGPC